MYGLYLHIPFCQKICYYCDFFVDKNLDLVQAYVNALCQEIEREMFENNSKPKLSTIYIGGGTPSLLSPNQMEQIVNVLVNNFDLSELEEFSMESNPGSVSLDTLKEYKSLGIDRLSIGVQSFIKRELGFLKRNHSPKKAIKAIEDAHKAGFNNINLDLIFAVPGQTNESWQYSLQTAFNLGTTHLSTYSLIYEEGTPLYQAWKNGKVAKTSDDDDADIYELTINEASKFGFKQYEVSNFAKNELYCKHNLGSWQGSEYFAFGASAHGHLDNKRFWRVKNLSEFISFNNKNKTTIVGEEIISLKAKVEESVFLALRSTGIDILKLNTKFNLDLAKVFEKEIEYYIKNDCVILENNLIKLTSKGYAICDSITLSFVSKIENYLEKNLKSLNLHNIN
jgi:oxygen-independent coproporphyrinogen-3 oxidase